MSLAVTEGSTAQEDGRHFEAYLNQQDLYRSVLAQIHHTRHRIDILDFGCGPHGVGRMLLTNLKGREDTLHLFDPYVAIEVPRSPRVRIANTQDVYGDRRLPFDIVNLSYVLCCMRPLDALSALRSLRGSHPHATIVIVEYTLAHRSKMEVLSLLTSDEEMKWRRLMGEDAFAETRRQFSPESLAFLLQFAGHSLQSGVMPLDRSGIRSAAIAVPQPLAMATPRARTPSAMSSVPMYAPLAPS